MYLPSTVHLEQSCLKERIHATWNVGFSLIFRMHLLKLFVSHPLVSFLQCVIGQFSELRDVGSLACSDVLWLQWRAQDINSLCFVTAHSLSFTHQASIMLCGLVQLITTQQRNQCLWFPVNVYNSGVQAKEKGLHGIRCFRLTDI